MAYGYALLDADEAKRAVKQESAGTPMTTQINDALYAASQEINDYLEREVLSDGWIEYHQRNPKEPSVIRILHWPASAIEIANPTIRSLNLHDFDLGCPASVQMAEIHSLPSGDVSNAFFELSLPMCLDHLLQYLEAIDSEVPPETAEQLFAITAGFGCNNVRRPSSRVRCD